MRVVVLVVGRARGTLADAIAEYEGRAARYWKLEIIEVADGTGGRGGDPDRARAVEADRIASRLPDGLEVIALTRAGRGMGSKELAGYLNEHALRSSPGVAFVIGGAFGLTTSVLERAQRRMSLSGMTLPHEMARLLLAEQLYRAGTIARGEPYHKG